MLPGKWLANLVHCPAVTSASGPHNEICDNWKHYSKNKYIKKNLCQLCASHSNLFDCYFWLTFLGVVMKKWILACRFVEWVFTKKKMLTKCLPGKPVIARVINNEVFRQMLLLSCHDQKDLQVTTKSRLKEKVGVSSVWLRFVRNHLEKQSCFRYMSPLSNPCTTCLCLRFLADFSPDVLSEVQHSCDFMLRNCVAFYTFSTLYKLIYL